MAKTDTCLKCGSTAHELKTIVLPTKKTHEGTSWGRYVLFENMYRLWIHRNVLS